MLNEKEKNIISLFLKNLDEYENEEMTLLWNNSNKVVALFDTCFEDENDYDENSSEYEEFISFSFTLISEPGNAPICVTEDNGFLINYHNFPDEILAPDGKKIN